MGNQPSGKIQKIILYNLFNLHGGGGGGSGGNMPSFNPSAMATPMIAQSSSGGLVNVNGRLVRIFYCMAYGGVLIPILQCYLMPVLCLAINRFQV